MSSMHSIIYQVLRKKSILDYLEKKGFQPVKVLPGGKHQYLCPFPDHNETKPSFIVYSESGEHENFHCYGCQRHYNIIHLVAGLEGLTFREALAILSEGMEVSLSDGIDIEIERYNKTLDVPREVTLLENALVEISELARNYLESEKNDPEECCIMDKMFESIDRDVFNCNFEGVYDTHTHLLETLKLRRKFLKKKWLEKAREECELNSDAVLT